MTPAVVLVVFFGGLVVELGAIVVLGRTVTRPWEKMNALRAPVSAPWRRMAGRPEHLQAGLHRVRRGDDPLLPDDGGRPASFAREATGRNTGDPARG
jgi:hypothetical protein